MAVFNTREWLRGHIIHADRLDDLTWDAVSGFTVLWNVFESAHCKRWVSVAAIERLADRLGPHFVLPENLLIARHFWLDRYVIAGETNHLFEGLHLDRNKREDFVRRVLLNANAPSDDWFKALLLIVYRLRNNLFHGEKGIPDLNDQAKNLSNACLTLATALEILH